MTHIIFIASKQHKYKDKTGQSTSSPVHDNIALLKQYNLQSGKHLESDIIN